MADNNEGKTLVRLNIKSALGKRGDLVYMTDQQLDDHGLYVDILEPGELDYVYRRPATNTPPAPVWGDDDDDPRNGPLDG